MVIDEETEQQIKDIVSAAIEAYAITLVGRRLGDKRPRLRLDGPLQLDSLTVLEQAYVAGRMAEILGTDRVRNLNPEQFKDVVRRSGVTLTDADDRMLNQLQKETEAWLLSRRDDAVKRATQMVNEVNNGWVSEGFDVKTALEQQGKRAEGLSSLSTSLGALMLSQSKHVDGLIDTKLTDYYQSGFVENLEGEELVWKLPRATACEHCLRLHLNPDGSAKIYRLSDVAGNSNIGASASEWVFVIGPVHPYCQCVLYRATELAPPGENDTFATIRRNALEKSVGRMCDEGELPPLLKQLRESVVQSAPVVFQP